MQTRWRLLLPTGKGPLSPLDVTWTTSPVDRRAVRMRTRWAPAPSLTACSRVARWLSLLCPWWGSMSAHSQPASPSAVRAAPRASLDAGARVAGRRRLSHAP